MSDDTLQERIAAFEVVPAAQPYYGRVTLGECLSDLATMVEEWDYAEDAHGYCHVRSMLVTVLTAIAAPDNQGSSG